MQGKMKKTMGDLSRPETTKETKLRNQSLVKHLKKNSKV